MELAGWLGSNWLRAAAYAVATSAAFLAGWREQRRARVEDGLWPRFWFTTAGLFLVMTIGRAADLGGWVTELGRTIARSHGWYNHRHKPQVIAIGLMGTLWFVTVVVAFWKVPARRRRYLPGAIVVFSLMCFAVIRLVSLHQVDGLFERRRLAGVEVGAIVELASVAMAIVVTFWQPRRTLALDPVLPR